MSHYTLQLWHWDEGRVEHATWELPTLAAVRRQATAVYASLIDDKYYMTLESYRTYRLVSRDLHEIAPK